MKLLTTIILTLPTLTLAQVDFNNWHPPGPDDARGPCPVLNTLANHGIIPRDGKNLTSPVLIKGMMDGLNVSAEISATLAAAGLQTSNDPVSGAFDLDDLDKHNIIEHDGSLSRQDVSMPGAEKQAFNETIFDEFLGYFNSSASITLAMAAAGRWGRMQAERNRDPQFTYSATSRLLSYAESAVYFTLLKDAATGTVPLDFVRILFQQERLPVKEGWRPTNVLDPLGLADTILQLSLNTPEDPEMLVPAPALAAHAAHARGGGGLFVNRPWVG